MENQDADKIKALKERLSKLENDLKNDDVNIRKESELKNGYQKEMQEFNHSVNHKPHLRTGAEKTLYMFSNISLVLGIILTFFCAYKLIFIEVPHYSYYEGVKTTTEFRWEGLIATLSVFASTIFTWAVLRVQANISMTLKEINNKIK